MLKVLILFLTVASLASAGDVPLGKKFRGKVFKNPLREISIIVTDDGFYPNKIMAHEGEVLRFFVTSTSKKAQCFVLQKHDVFIAAETGVINEIEIEIKKPGRFKFYCPSSKFLGYLTVIEKSLEDTEQARRDIASKKHNYWMPRDYD